MPRYILIDTRSGLVSGDTGTIDNLAHSAASPIEAARLVTDQNEHQADRTFEDIGREQADGRHGYLVYQPSDHFPYAFAGAGGDVIGRVKRECQFVGTVLVREPVGSP
jgi:hypothetical protein